MDSFRSLCQWAYRIFVGAPYVRWYFQLEDLEREKTARLAQELIDSVNSIFQCLDNLDRSVERELKKKIHRLKLVESNTVLQVFESLYGKFKSIQPLQQTNEKNEYTLSKKVKSEECVKTLLDKKTRFGQKIRTIKEYCREDDQGYVIVNVAINFELGIDNIISKLYHVCNILRNSELGLLPINVLEDKSCNIKEQMSTHGRNLEYADVCPLLEEVMFELRPMCSDLTLKVSKMVTALEDRFQTENY